jgi:hypothetical protein
MAQTLTLPTALRNTLCDAVVDTLDAGAGAATLEVRTGSTPGGGTLLLTFTLNDPAFGSSSAGAAALATGTTISATAAATGTAGHARLKDSDGTVRLDGLSVGTSGASVNLSTLSVTSGVVFQLQSGTCTQPAT